VTPAPTRLSEMDRGDRPAHDVSMSSRCALRLVAGPKRRSASWVDHAAWETAAGVVYADFAVDEWLEPPWSRS